MPPCQCKYKMCFKLFKERRREIIHKSFWEQSYTEPNRWLFSCVKVIDKQQSHKRKPDEDVASRKERVVLAFTLPNELGVNISICQKMFLNTMGFTSNQKIVLLCEKTEASDITVPADQHGKKEPLNKKNAEIHQMMKEPIFFSPIDIPL